MPLHTYHKTIKLNNQTVQSNRTIKMLASTMHFSKNKHPRTTHPTGHRTRHHRHPHPRRTRHHQTGTRMKARSLRTQQCTAPPPPPPPTPPPPTRPRNPPPHGGRPRRTDTDRMIISVPQLQGTPRTTTPTGHGEPGHPQPPPPTPPPTGSDTSTQGPSKRAP